MKKRFLNFLKKYWLCILLSVIMVVGMFLSERYAYLYESDIDSNMMRGDLQTLYFFGVIPLYSFVYGCLSYIKTKKVWVPQLILFIVAFLYLFIFDINEVALGGTFLFSAVPVIISLIGTTITAFFYYIIKSA